MILVYTQTQLNLLIPFFQLAISLYLLAISLYLFKDDGASVSGPMTQGRNLRGAGGPSLPKEKKKEKRKKKKKKEKEKKKRTKERKEGNHE